MTPPRRHVVLMIALAIALSASAWTRWQEVQEDPSDKVSDAVEHPAVPEKSSAAPSSEKQADTLPKLPLERLSRFTQKDAPTEEAPAVSGVDPFRPKSWYVAPPAPPPPPPPKPTAPPLPFQFMGKKEVADGSGTLKVYLSRGNEVFTVSPGDTFDTNYRFEKIDKGALVIQYLPLSTPQRLPLGMPE